MKKIVLKLSSWLEALHGKHGYNRIQSSHHRSLHMKGGGGVGEIQTWTEVKYKYINTINISVTLT